MAELRITEWHLIGIRWEADQVGFKGTVSAVRDTLFWASAAAEMLGVAQAPEPGPSGTAGG